MPLGRVEEGHPPGGMRRCILHGELRFAHGGAMDDGKSGVYLVVSPFSFLCFFVFVG